MSQSPRCWKVTVDPELGQDLSGNPAAKAGPPSHEALSVTEALPATDSSSASKQRDSDGTEHEGTVNPGEDGNEGGVRAWLAILGSFLVYFASFGVANSFGYFQTFYQLEYLPDSSPSVISLIGTIQITLLYLTGSVAGALFDAYGFKYLYPVAALGGAGSLLATSFTQPRAIWQLFLAQGLLLGLTISAGVQPALAVAGQYFRQRRALAMGIVASGSSAGGVCLPIMFQRLVPLIGFRWAMRVGALIVSVCYIIAICVSRAKFPPKQLKSARELLDFNGFRDSRYTTMAVGAFIANLGLYIPYYYIEPYCKFLDPDSSVTEYLLPLINGTSLFGRIAGGYAADKLGRLNILYPMIILSGLFCLAMWLPAASPPLVVAFTCFYGFTSGIFISVMPAATGQISPVDKLGARIGAFSTAMALPVLVGTPIAGALIQEETAHGYQPLIIFSGCTMLGGGIITFVARGLHDKNLLSKW